MTKILVVDDAADNVKLLACNLEDEGYAVATASDGPEALRLARTEHPDLMLLDIMMPGMDGTEVCRQVKADPELKDIPIIMVTAKHLDEDVVKGLDAGADDYVSKPVHNDILAATEIRPSRQGKPRRHRESTDVSTMRSSCADAPTLRRERPSPDFAEAIGRWSGCGPRGPPPRPRANSSPTCATKSAPP